MTALLARVTERIERMTKELLQLQSPDGAWRMCCQSGIMPDCYFIILIGSLGLLEQEQPLIQQLAARIAGRQETNGSWRLYHDNVEGHLDTTIEAYYALLHTNHYSIEHPRMQQAKQYILSRGGLSQTGTMLTQVMLAVTGQADYPRSLHLPLELFLTKHALSIDLYSLSGHARAHLIPVLLLANSRFTLHTARTPDLSDLYISGKQPFRNDAPWAALLASLAEAFTSNPIASLVYPSAAKDAEEYMLSRIEPNGTLLTYSTSTMLMVLALLQLGYKPESPRIRSALEGIKSLLCSSISHIPVATSTVWDTAMLSSTLQQAGTAAAHPSITRAAQYLRTRQHTKRGDWTIRSPHTVPGGWGFSDVNTLYPDVDDTVAALRALKHHQTTPERRDSWERGLQWVLAMHNDDGGWPAFERNNGSPLLPLLSFEGAKDIVVDPSTTDLTSRTLLFLGEDLGFNRSSHYPWLLKAVRWLLNQQEDNGSWYGRWGIAYTHGTGAAIEALTAVGLPSGHKQIQRGVRWLEAIQLEDGGWGESCSSDHRKLYIPLGSSTPSQTAWALDGLMAASSQPTIQLNRGIHSLLDQLELPTAHWTHRYPTGAGLPGSVYSHYDSNNYIWPLRTLARYRAKYGIQ
ncbi:prenyltransferase/squalene oxidase repeat-containing protein [Paenibacillus sp. GCM10023252]|uniref:terpene cyclase/mutase family protein n=1 Tax=Paenibacillus sp. GCM10023252 TaxID=3252649 RepID=UPI00362423B4